MNNIIAVNKPQNITSRDVVDKISKHFRIKKVGHAGTLDPMATGVLIICIKDGTKIVQFLVNDQKEYKCEITLGYESETEDLLSGPEVVTKEVDVENISTDVIDKVLNSLIGKQKQQVPMYSAVKVEGKKLYEYARKGIVIEDRPIKDIEILKLKRSSDVIFENNKIKFSFDCMVSKGTFIRTLCVQIAKELGTIGAMSNLERTRSGNFKIEETNTIEEVLANDYKEHSLRKALSFPEVEVNEYIANKIKNGSKLEDRYDSEFVTFIYNDKAIAVYKKYKENEMKAERVF